MDEQSLYAYILNLPAPWQVQSPFLDEKSGSVTVIIGIAEHIQAICGFTTNSGFRQRGI